MNDSNGTTRVTLREVELVPARPPVDGRDSQTDAGVAAARHTEDVLVGEDLVRHRRSTRIIHWSTSLLFFACLFTGMPIWSPIFGWMASFFGGLAVCRWLHPILGVAFFVASVVMFFHWVREMILEPSERDWLGPKLVRYMRLEPTDPDTGKYNGGQKLLFWAVSLASLGMLLSGVVMWFPASFQFYVREAAILVHDITFVLFAMAIVGHIYLGTAAEPGTFHSMTRGTVTKRWARFHHPRWYREVTGEDSRPL